MAKTVQEAEEIDVMTEDKEEMKTNHHQVKINKPSKMNGERMLRMIGVLMLKILGERMNLLYMRVNIKLNACVNIFSTAFAFFEEYYCLICRVE